MRTSFCIFLLSLLLLPAISSAQIDPPEVSVGQGTLRGTREGELAVYKGIPFAAPPVGPLRWKAPQPPAPWEDVREATDFAPSPYQPGTPPAGKSEDCLYLNVWTPAKSPDEALPVMVWIYGGGFAFGTTADPTTTGTRLAERGVIVVSVAYRVGPLGFLAHPELTGESPDGASGNYGLLDQITGLQWVHDNIAAFGGDPNRVTIFGESAGGISVSMLCASPLATGLFQGAISESGGSFGPTRPTTYPGENMKTLAQAEGAGAEYAEAAGASTLAKLRSMDPDSLPMGMGVGGGWPIVDGYVIPDDQYTLYREGKYNDVPVLLGYNSDEGLSFTRERSPEEFRTSVEQRYGKFADTLLAAYPPGERDIPKTARDLNRDAAFGWHTWTWAKLQTETGTGQVYLYYFDNPPAASPGDHGSPHAQDVAYVFGTLDRGDPAVSAADQQLSEVMGAYWTNFAKTGDPNAAGLPQWPAFQSGEPTAMYLTDAPHPGPVPSEVSLGVLDAYFRWRLLEGGMPVTE